MAASEAFEDAIEGTESSLSQLVEQETLKWIFVGGKGGVGKTTTACSIAVELAARRTSVLLISTDPAHNISDAFRQKFTNKPTKVQGFENLCAMEIDASFQDSLEFELKRESGFSKVMQELVGAFPGVDEAMGFAELMQSVQSMDYSVIVFDTAPTGHTLRLLGFPELLDRGLSKLGQLQTKFGGLLQMIQSLADQDVREEELQHRVSNLRAASNSVRDIFQDPLSCTFVCVCIPEFLSVYETERLIQALCEHGIDASNIVVNQVLFADDCGDLADSGPGVPELQELAARLRKLDGASEEDAAVLDRAVARMRALEKGWDMCRKKRAMQSRYLAQIRDLYQDDFHIVPVPMLGEEVRGLDALRGFADLLVRSSRALPVGE